MIRIKQNFIHLIDFDRKIVIMTLFVLRVITKAPKDIPILMLFDIFQGKIITLFIKLSRAE